MLKKIILLFVLLRGAFIRAQDTITPTPLPKQFVSLEKYNAPKVFRFDSVTVFAICTGYISTDKKFPEPVFTWLIQTPEGNFLIDGGLPPGISSPNYFKGISKPFFEKQFDFYIYKSNDLLLQLEKIGVGKNITKILLTHAHFDHIGYLKQLDQAPLVMSKTEKEAVEWKGQLAGYQKGTEDLIGFKRLEYLDLKDLEVKRVNKYLSVFQTGEHTKGHMMIVLHAGGKKILFSGDINLKTISHNTTLYKFIEKNFDMGATTLFFNHDQDL